MISKDKKNKKGLVWTKLGLWIIGIAVLTLVVIGIFILQKKGINLFDKIKDILRFGR